MCEIGVYCVPLNFTKITHRMLYADYNNINPTVAIDNHEEPGLSDSYPSPDMSQRSENDDSMV